MKFWEKYSRIIFKLLAQPKLKIVYPKLLEQVLAKAPQMLDDEMIFEIRSFILNQQTVQGGFADRGGKCDLYYTLFGFYIAEAFSVTEAMEPLKNYVKALVVSNDLSGVYRYCGAILYARLVGLDETAEKLREQIVLDFEHTLSKQPVYSGFLGILALYYLNDFQNIQRIISRYSQSINSGENYPCPVRAANAVILKMTGKSSLDEKNILKSFYRKSGGFAALHHAPAEDLLSTGVALYALHFIDADIRLIKPECLNFIDNLYDQGGFRSTFADSMTDVEYTFYGLLALGSLS